MEIIRGYHNIRSRHRGCVMTIGNFDGVHRGHQQLLEHVKQEGKRLQLPTVLVTFEPLPQEFFGSTLARLSRLREKLLLLKKYKIDRVVVLRFNQSLANLSAEDFVKQIILDGLAARYVLVGEDFHFGARRTGNINLLKIMSEQYHFSVETFKTIYFQGQRISSSLIREALLQGDLLRANTMLGYNYGMDGRVVHGDKRGRELGVPTANIFIHRQLSPLLGIFVVLLHGIGPKPLPGVASLGYRPTVSDDNTILLEVHLFDFDQNIYDRYVHVEFLKKLRDEIKFDSLTQLKNQMLCDIEQAKAYF